jgi:RNA polymerase sigma-70 factor, ECF subfamily
MRTRRCCHRQKVRDPGSAENDAAREVRAQCEVSTLYQERGEEFLHYALSLGRDDELARDALQEVFMRFFVALCEGEVIASPRAWIYCVMHNYLLDRINETHQHEARLREVLRGQESHDIERECLRKEFLRLVPATLTAREFDCFRLRAEGMRYREIAASLHLSSGAVGTLVHRAIRKLRTLMAPAGGERT